MAGIRRARRLVPLLCLLVLALLAACEPVNNEQGGGAGRPRPTTRPGSPPIIATIPPFEATEAPPQARNTPLSGPLVTVESIIDGDTIDLDNGQRVRLLGINTPERDQPFYAEARQFARDLLEGQQVRVETDVQTNDRYGRLLAYLYLADGTFANLEIVRRGYAQALTVAPNARYEQALLSAEREAREARRGLWATSTIPLEIVALEPNPPGSDEQNLNDEIVIIANAGSGPVDLDGFILSDRGNQTFIFPPFTLQGGAEVTIHAGGGRDGRNDLFWGADGPVWNNDGDSAFLRDTQGNLIDVYEYGAP